MDGKELEIKRRFKAGDMVVFRLGERENQTCPHCGVNTYDSEHERRLISRSGQVFQVMGTLEELELKGSRICVECGGETTLLHSSYVLRDVYTFSNGQQVHGFAAYERELSPATPKTKNEMLRCSNSFTEGRYNA